MHIYFDGRFFIAYIVPIAYIRKPINKWWGSWYERGTFILRKSFDAVAILNLAGILGWAVDFATGAIMKYDRTNYDLDPKAFNIEELENDQLGRLIIPNEERSVIVYYKDAEIKLLFN